MFTLVNIQSESPSLAGQYSAGANTFYLPKASSQAQALEASANLSRMLQEIPLQEGERAAVEDGIEAMVKLVDGLRDTAAPDGRTPVEIAAQDLDSSRPKSNRTA